MACASDSVMAVVAVTIASSASPHLEQMGLAFSVPEVG